MTREQEIASLKANLRAREGRPGCKANVEEIKARLKALEAE